jgi:hypothetical protein
MYAFLVVTESDEPATITSSNIALPYWAISEQAYHAINSVSFMSRFKDVVSDTEVI